MVHPICLQMVGNKDYEKKSKAAHVDYQCEIRQEKAMETT